MRLRISRGEDPVLTKRRERAKSVSLSTVRKLAEDYREKVMPGLAPKTVIAHEYHLSAVIVPKLGAMLVSDVTGADVVAMIESARRPWVTSSHILNTTSRLFSHAIGRRVIVTNPCTGIDLSAVMGPRPAKRERLMLSDAELRAILPRIDSMGRQNALNFRVQLATGVRSGELCQSMWSEFDLDAGVWTIPAGRIKTRASNPRAFRIPLAPEVIVWLRELKAIAGRSRYVLPGRQEKRADTHQAENTFSAAVERFQLANPGLCRRFVPHDLRSTARSHMGAMGVSSDIAERAINHVIPGMAGVYDKGDYFPERKAALELWARFLVACERGEQ
ncbi:hypothetical protein R8510_04411 [Ralstonia chuxiongensis]|nr:hypothetical protein R8510_04411 [Ralstonia chuxiongensis]